MAVGWVRAMVDKMLREAVRLAVPPEVARVDTSMMSVREICSWSPCIECDVALCAVK